MKIALVDDEKLYADKIDDICRRFFEKNGAEIFRCRDFGPCEIAKVLGRCMAAQCPNTQFRRASV